jgi:Tfp pilus assembly protein PilF
MHKEIGVLRPLARYALLGLLAIGPGGCMSFSPASIPALQAIPGGESTDPGAKKDLEPRESARLSINLAEGMEKNGHPLEAIALYEKARQLDPRLSVKASRHLALLYDQLGESPKAVAEYEQAIKATPRDADLLNSYGYYFYSRGQWAEAESQLRLAVAANPKHQRAWTNLGMTLAQQQRYAESLDAFGRVNGSAAAYSNVAFILTTQGKRDEAKRYYREALQLDPNMAIARLALAKLEKPAPANPEMRPPTLPVAARPAAEPLPDLSPVVVREPATAAAPREPADLWRATN